MLKKLIGCLLVFAYALLGSIPIFKGGETKYFCDTSYNESTSSATSYTQTFPYDTYTTNMTYLTRACPNYCYNPDLTNSCAPTAGTHIIGYYDYLYEDLIPNFVACYIYNNTYRYRGTYPAVDAVNTQLYSLMGTNTQSAGTSVAQFKSGLQEYVEDCGLNITYTKCGTRLDVTTAISYLNAQQPIALFMNSYYYFTIAGVEDMDSSIVMVGIHSTNGHVAIAYGYKEYVITKDNVTSTKKFLAVSFGDATQGFIPVNDVSIFEEAYAINIHA